MSCALKSTTHVACQWILYGTAAVGALIVCMVLAGDALVCWLGSEAHGDNYAALKIVFLGNSICGILWLIASLTCLVVAIVLSCGGCRDDSESDPEEDSDDEEAVAVPEGHLASTLPANMAMGYGAAPMMGYGAEATAMPMPSTGFSPQQGPQQLAETPLAVTNKDTAHVGEPEQTV